MKKHFAVINGTACGRGEFSTSDVRYVTCLLCQGTPGFMADKAVSDAQAIEAFNAQEPRAFSEPWVQASTLIECRECGGTLFRHSDRTCYGHYDNYVCSNCGGTESRLTETGMSF